jgi:hypothetical protein
LTLVFTASRSSAGSVTLTVAGAAVTPLSVTRRPGSRFSSTLVFDGTGVAPSSEYSASSLSTSGDV